MTVDKNIVICPKCWCYGITYDGNKAYCNVCGNKWQLTDEKCPDEEDNLEID
jgi:hypothetical protein